MDNKSIYKKLFKFNEFTELFRNYKNILTQNDEISMNSVKYYTLKNTVVEFINTNSDYENINMRDSSYHQNHIHFPDGKYIIIYYKHSNQPNLFWGLNGGVYLYPYHLLTEKEKINLSILNENEDEDKFLELQERVNAIKESTMPDDDDDDDDDDNDSWPDSDSENHYRNPSVHCGITLTGNFKIVKLDGISRGTKLLKSLVTMKPILHASNLRSAEKIYAPGQIGYYHAQSSFIHNLIKQESQKYKKNSAGKKKPTKKPTKKPSKKPTKKPTKKLTKKLTKKRT